MVRGDSNGTSASGTCSSPQLAELIIFYVKGQVNEEEAAAIEHHLEQCPECRKRLLRWVDITIHLSKAEEKLVRR